MSDTTLSSYGAFLLRVALGVMFLAHGLLKVLVFTIPGTVNFFHGLGVPAVFAYLTLLGEVGGGILLILGIGVRWVSLALIPVLAGALFLVHAGNGWVFTNAGGGWEYPAFLIVASLAQSFLGDGAFALSRCIPWLRARAA